MTAVQNNVPPPLGDPIALMPRWDRFKDGRDPLAGTVSKPWADYFNHNRGLGEKFPSRVAEVRLSNQGAGIAATDMTDGTLSSGLYRISYWYGITASAGGGPITLGLSWTYNATAWPFTQQAIDSGTITPHHGASFLLWIDATSPITYTVTYAAAGDRYDLAIVLEEVLA